MDNVINSSQYGSDTTFKGVKLSGPKGEKEVQLSGDKIEETPNDSFTQGLAKGIGVGLLGSSYPVLSTAFKSVEGYSQVYHTAKELGLDEWQSATAGLKGAFIGGLKGFAHGFLDFMVIGTLTAVGGALGGPVGAGLAATVGGGLYNVLKDAIRHDK
ncbi:MAG: hypothetical protein N2169_06415 [bacterium]|nr:hypothetical protein [bacterium]